MCSLSYFLDEMEKWEAKLVCDYLPFDNISGWEQIRTLCYFYTLSHAKKGTKLKPTDVLTFAWDEKQSKPEPHKATQEEIQELMARAKQREKYHTEI